MQIVALVGWFSSDSLETAVFLSNFQVKTDQFLPENGHFLQRFGSSYTDFQFFAVLGWTWNDPPGQSHFLRNSRFLNDSFLEKANFQVLPYLDDSQQVFLITVTFAMQFPRKSCFLSSLPGGKANFQNLTLTPH